MYRIEYPEHQSLENTLEPNTFEFELHSEEIFLININNIINVIKH